MLKLSDLNAAVGEGIISRDQAERLRDFAQRSVGMDDDTMEFVHDTRDEPFRLFRGFRDFFIFIGIIIFAVGLSGLAAGYLGGGTDYEDILTFSYSLRIRAVGLTFGLVVIGVALAEWITRRQRLPLSSLVTSLALAAWSAQFVVTIAASVLPGIFTETRDAAVILTWLYFLGAILGMLVFYWRYKLPFALLPLAGSVVGLLYFFIAAAVGPEWSGEHGRILIGCLGVGVFVAAMWFDVKDRLRVKRFSECAFWLHLLASPMIVHALLLGNASGTPNLALVLGSLAILAFLALLIDRRALLVSGLIYFAVAIGQIVASSSILSEHEFAFTASLLGASVLCLGLGWTPIRRVLVNALPLGGLKSFLPPVAAA